MSENQFSLQPFFVCREHELRVLHQAFLTAMRSRQPKFVLIQGDYGTGKTALVEYFIAEVGNYNPEVLVGSGRCTLEAGLNGLTPFSQLFMSLAEQGANQRIIRDNVWEFAKEVAPAWIDIFTAGMGTATVKTVD